MAKRKTGLLGRLLAAIIIIILLVAIVGAIFEIFIAPAPSKVEAKYKDNDSVSTIGTTGGIAAAAAKADLLLYYGYANSSLTDKVTNNIVITYKETKDGKETTYTAMVIYFEKMAMQTQ